MKAENRNCALCVEADPRTRERVDQFAEAGHSADQIAIALRVKLRLIRRHLAHRTRDERDGVRASR